jgi:divalent metal cation (Fe/Co/Zn/Cd) transporter
MLEGWARQQRVRFLKADTIRRRLELVRRFFAFCGLYPWQWTAGEVESFVDHLRSGPKPIVVSTARGYLADLQMFLDYLTDGRYGWPVVCAQRFGEAPQQVLGEWNTVTHSSEYEGQPGRRPLTYDEVQALFDAADGRVEEIRARGRKGGLAAQRDAALLKMVYAFGLRRREVWGLDLADLRRNPKVPAFGEFGVVSVRWGKASRGGSPKRRMVLLVPEMDWVVPVLQQWVGEIRPRFSPGGHPALWVTERCGRLSWRAINEAFVSARQAAGLDPVLDLHSLRHSYMTHLVEFDYPERFVQVLLSYPEGGCPAEQPVAHLAAVAVAALVGFAGNEIVARYRITVGRRIGSAALVADGLHARTDGFTSLAVLLGAGGAALGWHWADPAVGLGISVAIALVLRDAAREVYRRLMDAVDPHLVDQAEATLRAIPGVLDVGAVRLRWIGHRLHAEADLVVPDDLTAVQAHEVAADAEHQLTHAVARLTSATVHADPASHPGGHHHVDLSHDRRGRSA